MDPTKGLTLDPVKVTEQLLRALTDLSDQEAVIKAAYKQRRDDAVPPEVQAALMEIDADESEELVGLRAQIVMVEMQVKQYCLSAGKSIKSEGFQAVWSKPRVTWNAKALEGYAAAHPEIKPFREEGAPSVSIRKVQR